MCALLVGCRLGGLGVGWASVGVGWRRLGPNRHLTDAGLVVSALPAPYFEGAESISDLSLAQIQGFRVVLG